jgi:hypothetical protein
MKSLLKTILAALKKGTKVVVGKKKEERKASHNPAPKEKVKASELATSPIKEKTKKKIEEKAKKSAPVEKKASSEKAAGKDKYGARIGSQNAQINAALTVKSQPIEEIAKKVKLTASRVAGQLGALVRANVVKKSDKGYALCSK